MCIRGKLNVVFAHPETRSGRSKNVEGLLRYISVNHAHLRCQLSVKNVSFCSKQRQFKEILHYRLNPSKPSNKLTILGVTVLTRSKWKNR